MSKPAKPVSTYFGENIFDLAKMQQMLPKSAYEKIYAYNCYVHLCSFCGSGTG